MTPATHRATDRTENPQNRTDDQQDHTNRQQYRNVEDVSHYQQNDAQPNHDAYIPTS